MSDPRRSGLDRAMALAAGGALLVLAFRVGQRLVGAVSSTSNPVPLWDEAAQGYVAVQIADALRQGRPLELLALINAQVVWPPLHALLLAPLVLIHGPIFENGALMSAAALASTALLAFLAGTMLSRERGAWAGLAAAALVLGSPLAQAFGMLGMLEAPGACLLALALVCRLRALWHPHLRSAWIATGLSSAALMLLKYNYGLLWLTALAIFEWTERTPAERRAAQDSMVAWWTRGGWRHPVPLIAAAWALLLAAIVASGGFGFTLLGAKVSMRSPGNPAYGLLVFLAIAAWLAWRRDRDAWRVRWQRVSEPHRLMLMSGGLPLLAWFLIPLPNRVRALVEFSLNRSSGPAPWSLEGLLYYPRAVLDVYAPSPWLGLVALAALVVLPRGRAHDPAVRGAWLVWIAALVGMIATMGHRYHDPRFLFTTVLLLWLNAGRALAELAGRALRRAPRAGHTLATGVALVAILVPAWRAAAPGARALAARDGLRSPAALLEPVDAVLDIAATQPDQVALLGTSNALSPALLAWRARQRGLPFSRSVPPPRAGVPASAASPEAIAAHAEALMASGALTIVALPVPGSALDTATGAEVGADRAVAERLRFDVRLQAWTDTTFAVSGVRVEAYRRP